MYSLYRIGFDFQDNYVLKIRHWLSVTTFENTNVTARLTPDFSGHSDKKTFECEDCEATFNIKQNLDAHRTVHFIKFENKELFRLFSLVYCQ